MDITKSNKYYKKLLILLKIKYKIHKVISHHFLKKDGSPLTMSLFPQ